MRIVKTPHLNLTVPYDQLALPLLFAISLALPKILAVYYGDLHFLSPPICDYSAGLRTRIYTNKICALPYHRQARQGDSALADNSHNVKSDVLRVKNEWLNFRTIASLVSPVNHPQLP
jgi:hypothetical protein